MITDAFRLDGKVALITGASKGIGAGIASAFAEMGAHVALIARSEPELADVAASVTEHGVAALPIACDITQDDALSAAVGKLESEFGKLDILVNNAGGTGQRLRLSRARSTAPGLITRWTSISVPPIH
jgi:7-alpha-hydroxysteroid dehydrogenase